MGLRLSNLGIDERWWVAGGGFLRPELKISPCIPGYCVYVEGVYVLFLLRLRIRGMYSSMVLENIRSHGNKKPEAHNKLLVQFVAIRIQSFEY